jgi:pimeloyl-ACP methyl ester carboxylesterase
MVRWCVAVASVAILAACGTADDGGGAEAGGSGGGTGGSGGTDGTGGTGGTGGIVHEEPSWEPCTLEGGIAAECATLEMPLDRDDPATSNIPFFVRRLRADGQSRGQLWLLEGGPGYNGGQLGLYASTFLLDLGLDIYMPDYRGVGRSENLGCDDLESTSRLCMSELEARYGDDIVRFSTSDAIHDVGEAIQRLRNPGEQIFVWGTSYGTVAAHRFLHLFPNLANGVILDSSCGAAGCDMVDSDVDLDRNARDIAALCAEDEFCRGKLGSDPIAKAADVLDRVEAGWCADAVSGTGPDWIRPMFAQFMGPYFMPALGWAMIYRLDRCTPQDADAVANLLRIMAGSYATAWAIRDSVVNSDLLYFNIVFNEFWDPAITRADLERLEDGLVATTGSVVYFPGMYAGWSWPHYEVAADLKAWADVDVPVLILNGTLDAQTRSERMIDARDAFTAANQHVVIIPYAHHGTFMPDSEGSASYTCGAAITRQFLADPNAPLDLACVDAQTPPRFDTAEYQSYWFGTPDLYENVASALPPLAELGDPLARARLDEARARLHRVLEQR